MYESKILNFILRVCSYSVMGWASMYVQDMKYLNNAQSGPIITKPLQLWSSRMWPRGNVKVRGSQGCKSQECCELWCNVQIYITELQMEGRAMCDDDAGSESSKTRRFRAVQEYPRYNGRIRYSTLP